jgi:hypothetical protein
MPGKMWTSPLYGHDSFLTFASIEEAEYLRGKSKVEQMKAICEFHSLNSDAVKSAISWEVRKSKNLRFHPATYILTVRHKDRNALCSTPSASTRFQPDAIRL